MKKLLLVVPLIVILLATIGWNHHVHSVDVTAFKTFRQYADKRQKAHVKTVSELVHIAKERVHTKFEQMRQSVNEATQPNSLWYTEGRLNEYGAKMLGTALVSGSNSITLEFDCEDAIDRRYGSGGLTDLTTKLFGKANDERLLIASQCADVAISEAKKIMAEKGRDEEF